jgi:hypothetical protein
VIQRTPADRVTDLRPGDVVYWKNLGHWRGTIDRFVTRDHRWVSVSYDNGEGDDKVRLSEFTVERPPGCASRA